MIKHPHTRNPEELFGELQTHPKEGLSREAIAGLLKKYGENALQPRVPQAWWSILARQFLDPIIYILIVAAALALMYGSWVEAIAIMVVILFTVTIGFFMELQAVRSLETLSRMEQPEASVLRSGKIHRLPATNLVPGDILVLESGDVVPADARIFSNEYLETKESMLTGESTSVEKGVEVLPADTPVADQRNMVFRETVIAKGSGKAVVVATGMNTQLGQIQQLANEAVKTRSPLEKKLNQLSQRLIWLTLILAVLIVAAGVIRGEALLLMVETGVALAVAAIPEGLPIVATIALARGMLKLSDKQVIIKKITAVETLGAVNILCTDKTGTLTEDAMTVQTVAVAGKQKPREVSLPSRDTGLPEADSEAIRRLLWNGLLCNAVVLEAAERRGDPIDLALIRFAESMGYDPASFRKRFPKLHEIPFDTERKLMATLHSEEDGTFSVYVKGAFENVVSHCDTVLAEGASLNFEQVEAWHALVDELASRGLRTLAMAYRHDKQRPAVNALLEKLTFLGIVGFIDPARTDVRESIETCKKAGLQVVMMTGDHPGTAAKIALDIGLLKEGEEKDKVMRGSRIPDPDAINAQTAEQLRKTLVFARVSPKEKLDLISFYQAQGYTIGMMGDGVNDVPALKKADIGIAMGIRGTQAAREAADIILKNDHFTAMELAIRQGRLIFEHIRQFVVYLLSSNLAEILSVGGAALLQLPAPLLPLQILFLNLVTDVFPALALGTGKGDPNLMAQPPRTKKEPIMTARHWKATIVYGLCITLAVLGVVIYAHYRLNLTSMQINNMAFYTLVLGQLLNVFNVTHRKVSFFHNEVMRNPWVWGAILLCGGITLAAYHLPPVALALSLIPLGISQIGTVLLFGFGSLLLAQLLKRSGIAP